MANPYVKVGPFNENTTPPLSAANMNLFDQGIFDAHFQPTAYAYHSANQSIGNATWTTVALNSERYDTDTIHDLATNTSRLTCKTAGKYSIVFYGLLDANATGHRFARILLNGTTPIVEFGAPSLGASHASRLICTIQWDLAVNDFVEAQVFQDSGGALNLLAVTGVSPGFMWVRVA
jgi:hypothetical protein